MKKVYILNILLYTFIGFQLAAQKDTAYAFGEDPGEIEYYFGFNLVPNAMGGMIHLGLIKPGDNGKRTIKQLTKDDFIAQAKGKQQSLANPKAIDFFEKYKINNPNVLDDLWRLRYQEYPYFSNEKIAPGWSANDSIPFLPSETQLKTLENFGLMRLSNYIYGKNAFELLRLMEQPQWIKDYKESY